MLLIIGLVIPYNVYAAEITKNNTAENLALNKPVEGSPDIYIQPENPKRYAVENAVDGDLSSLWGPVGDYPQSGNLIIDLESAQKYNCVKFYGRSNDTVSRTDRIVVLGSDDKETWEEVASQSCTETNMIISFDDYTSRYVQIQMVPKEGKPIPAMAELEIFWIDPDAPQTLETFTLSKYSYVDLNDTLTLEKNCIDDLGKEIPDEKVNFTFESSDPSIASVSNDGIVTGNTKGKVTITATAESNGSSVTVKKTIYSGYITPEPQGDNEEPSEAQIDMIENRNYGLMMHFGINTFNNCQWSDGTLPVSSYKPDTIDADQWARVASEAGFTHIVVVSMHHDGFCMWDTQYTDYKCTNPESGNTTDVIKELSKACEKYGIKLGLYYSLWNRHESYYNDDLVYTEHMKNQFSELLGGEYGEISEIWLDGAWDKATERWYLPELYDCIKTLQPNCQVGVNQTIGINNGTITDPSNYKKYENIKYFPTDFKTWDGKTIADYDEPKIFTHEGENYYLPYEETVCVRNPFGGFSWFWDNSYNAGDLYPVESILQSMEKLHSRDNIFLLNMGIDPSGHMVEDDIATVYKAADAMNIAKGSAIGANQLADAEEKSKLQDTIDACRNIDQTPYTKASVNSMLNQVNEAEEKLTQDTDLRNADVVALINLINKAKNNLVVIEGNENLALEKEIVDASPRAYSDGFVPENAVDGDDKTLWGPVDGSNESYIMIDLGKERSFNEICMDGRASDTVSRTESYEILAGNQNLDGSYQLETVLKDVSCTAAKQTIKFESVTARYVKIIIHATDNKVPAYKEISIYDHSDQEVVETDKSALQIAIEMAEAADLENVVPAVVNEFNEALTNAKEVYTKTNAMQSEVDSAFERLADVMQMLEFYQGDKTALQKQVNDINALDESKYIESSWQAMLPVLDKANAVLADENAMQDEVNEVFVKLVKAFLDLRLKPNKDLLNDLINKTQSLNSASYTPESWKVVAEALDNAIILFEDLEADQAAVDSAKDVLTKAILGLTEINQPIDTFTDVLVSNNNTSKKSVDTGDLVILISLFSLLLSAGAIVLLKNKKEIN